MLICQILTADCYSLYEVQVIYLTKEVMIRHKPLASDILECSQNIVPQILLQVQFIIDFIYMKIFCIVTTSIN